MSADTNKPNKTRFYLLWIIYTPPNHMKPVKLGASAMIGEHDKIDKMFRFINAWLRGIYSKITWIEMGGNNRFTTSYFTTMVH